MHASPSPHLYLVDSIGSTDDWSLLIGRPEWAQKLKDINGRSVELTPEDTAKQLADTAKLGTRVLWLGHDLTAANTQWIIEHAHQLGLVTYGEFISTPYRVGVLADVDVLLHMSRYELGVVPDELQLPLVTDPEGPASKTAYGYSERLPPTDYRLRDYAKFLASHRTALMPTFSMFYLSLPNHRNLWLEPAAKAMDPRTLSPFVDRKTGEIVYPLAPLPPSVGCRTICARRQICRLAGYGLSTAQSSRHFRTTWQPVAHRRWAQCPASRCIPSWKCWCAWDCRRVKPWPPRPTTTLSSSAGSNSAKLLPDAAPIFLSFRAIPPSISGMSGRLTRSFSTEI